jgi:hypothetical protein
MVDAAVKNAAIKDGPRRLGCYFEHGSDALESKEGLRRSSVEVPCRITDRGVRKT